MDLNVLDAADLEAEFYRGLISSMGTEAKKRRNIQVVVFVGAYDARQFEAFSSAYSDAKMVIRRRHPNVTISTEYIYNDKMHSSKGMGGLDWGPSDLTNAILRSDIHFIITHAHQGNIARGQERRQGVWCVDNIYSQMRLWKYHLGFPMGKYLSCPVFTQNKKMYIIHSGLYCTPSIFIDIPHPDLGLSASDLNRLGNFVNEFAVRYDNKFAVKLPFVTHSQPKYSNNGVDGILQCIQRYAKDRKVFGFIPYVIIQPRFLCLYLLFKSCLISD